MILAKRRQEQTFLKTRALVEATLAPHVENKKSFAQALEDYANAMFPYLQRSRVDRDELAKKALKEWTSKIAFRVKPLWQANHGTIKAFRSKLRRGAERVQEIEAARRSGKQRRIG